MRLALSLSCFIAAAFAITLVDGSFQEFLPIIKPLTETRTNVSFNVMVPSLPGFVFSSAPPFNWTVDDTARIFNTLMTEVLGYSTYAVHGTDWGSTVGYTLYESFNTTVRAAYFVFLPFFSPSAQEIVENNITLSDTQNVTEQRVIDWIATGDRYLVEQGTKPNDIGQAFYNSPVGQLAWIGGKFKLWSDPRAGTLPSVINNTAILTSGGGGGGQYEYNVGYWPEEYVAKVGNLVAYKFQTFEGHFSGLDNPYASIENIREIAAHFKA
ncbi:Alpha/Beta hydrolase protein [Mycena epipterygia]|nr:Alpha/Beta hydrolase protein [Mycena epipterygia]